MMELSTSWISRATANGLPVALLSRAGLFSPSVTCIRSDKSPEILKAMRSEGYELGGGQPPLTKTTFRIGHMGDHTVRGVEAMLEVLGRMLQRL